MATVCKLGRGCFPGVTDALTNFGEVTSANNYDYTMSSFEGQPEGLGSKK